MGQYKTSVVDGRQFLNGREVETLINSKERTCIITDPGDRDRLAKRSFEAGALVARRDPSFERDELNEIIDASVGVRRPVPRQWPRRRRK
jgi:hypothetical protein